jgi:predicted CXXCH cytochrome family protein
MDLTPPGLRRPVFDRARQRLVRSAPLLFTALAILAATPFIPAQENDDCLMCHADADLTGTRDGAEISVFVDAESYAASVHAGLDCITCHGDLDGAELPHDEDTESVQCGMCHEDRAEEHDRSLHGQATDRGDELAPSCATCHGTHDIRSHTDPTSPTAIMNIPLLCGRCHHEGTEVSLEREIPQDRILENYSLSIHGEGLFRQGLTVTAVCTSCHTSHNILPHTDSRSSIHHENVAGTCTQCHAQIESVHRQVIEGRLWEQEPHKIPACVDCHSPHRIRRVFYLAGTSDADCLKCHGQEDLVMERNGVEVSLFVDAVARQGAAHRDVACGQCHGNLSPGSERSCETVATPVDCSVCHALQVHEFRQSTHGTLLAAGDPDAPGCQDCHTEHATQKKNAPVSPTFARNVPSLCARCHRIGESAAKRIEADVPDIVQSYVDSIHGKGLLESGLVVTATCANCHSAHLELPPSDARSTVNPANIADTCGGCHHGIEETFKTSIHFRTEGDPERELPTCEDCHTSHTISRTDIPGFRLVMMEQCGRCHVEEAETFFDTFHGKVSRLGSEGAAKCYDCHGTHDILPAANPASRLGREHVVTTCGQCHEGAHRRFAGYLTHATHHDPAKYPYLFTAFWAMTALLVGTLFFALLHTLAWLIRLWLTRDEWTPHKVQPGETLVRRFNRLQRSLHISMILSFFTLSLTGMALKFSYMSWAQVLSRLLGGFHTMGVLHRLGAVALFIVFFIHLWDLRRQKIAAGQSWWRFITAPGSMLLNLTDVKEAWQSLKWFIGRGPRPKYGRFTYWEKFDYFAVFWGIAIIGSTGLVLWFPELFTKVLPGWSVNVVTIIHSDEALLATAFIFTVHFFNTNFRPDKFPIDTAMFTGRVPLDELKYDKPREYAELVSSGDLEQHIVDPLPEPALRVARGFGFTFLTIGLILTAFILYTMLFGYR